MRRERILALLVASIFINYADRSNLSIAAPLLEKEFALGPARMGALLAAFSWTYALLQLFGVAGWLADRFDSGRVLAAGFVVWSLATAASGLAGGFAGLFVMRLLLGAGESVAYPCYAKILARHFPEERRGVANALLDAGSKMGPALGTLLGGLLVARIGWRWLFVVLGLASLLWLPAWLRWRPRDAAPGETTGGARAPGFRDILRTRAAWGSYGGIFCANYYWFFLLTWLPLYLVRARGFSLDRMAWVGSLAFFVVGASTVVAGWVSDRWIARGGSVNRVRKTIVVGGLLFSGIILPVAVIDHDGAAMGLLLAACAGFGVFASNHWAIAQTLAGPAAAGRWVSLQNGFGNLAGIAAPWVTGVAVGRTGSFHAGFLIAAVLVIAGAAMYAFAIGPVKPLRFGREPE